MVVVVVLLLLIAMHWVVAGRQHLDVLLPQLRCWSLRATNALCHEQQQ
jgi:hypothetical protein